MSVRTLIALSSTVLFCATFAPGAGARHEASSATGCTTAARALAGASAMSVFHDYIEDTPGPDICAENAVTNDNEGTITFGLHIHNRSTYGANERYGVFLDTDNNVATGPEGAEYIIRVASDSVELAKWDGTAFVSQEALAPSEWVDGYGPIWQVNAAQLGGVQSFGFFFYTTDGVNADFAPDTGEWSYQLTPLQLSARSLSLDRARAGRPFSARLAVVRSDFDAPLVEGVVACTGRLGNRALAGTGRFAGGRAVCTFRLPKTARGKRLSGSVSVTFQGAQARRTFTTVVR